MIYTYITYRCTAYVYVFCFDRNIIVIVNSNVNITIHHIHISYLGFQRSNQHSLSPRLRSMASNARFFKAPLPSHELCGGFGKT